MTIAETPDRRVSGQKTGPESFKMDRLDPKQTIL